MPCFGQGSALSASIIALIATLNAHHQSTFYVPADDCRSPDTVCGVGSCFVGPIARGAGVAVNMTHKDKPAQSLRLSNRIDRIYTTSFVVHTPNAGMPTIDTMCNHRLTSPLMGCTPHSCGPLPSSNCKIATSAPGTA